MVGPPGMALDWADEPDGSELQMVPPEVFEVDGVEWTRMYWTTGRVVVFVYFREDKGWVWNDFRGESDGHDTYEDAMRAASIARGVDLNL